MPTDLIIVAVAALLAGLLLMVAVLAVRRQVRPVAPGPGVVDMVVSGDASMPGSPGSPGSADSTLRVVWWLTIAIVLLGVGISGSFAVEQAPIFAVGAGAVLAVIVFRELPDIGRLGGLIRLVELLAATALVGGLLALTGYAASPFTMLFALVAVAAALAYGPRAGLVAAVMATVAFSVILALDPARPGYGPGDALRLSVGLIAIWLLAFVAVAYASHQRRAMQRVIDLLRIDPLTGLFNRSQLFVTLEQEVSRTRRSDRGFCVLMIDLDGLKEINDAGGHLRGDEVLRALGSVISGSIRTVDSAYRFGGDEFVVLLPETDIVGAFVVAEKIRMGAEEVGLTLSGSDEPVTSVSIGLVSHPEDGTGAEQLIAAADRAMYEAKKLGKNQICGNPRVRPTVPGRERGEPSNEPPEEPPPGPAPGQAGPAEPAAGEPARNDAPPVSARPVEPPVMPPPVEPPVMPPPVEPPVMPRPVAPPPVAPRPPVTNGGTPASVGGTVTIAIEPHVEPAPHADVEIDDAEPDPGVVRRNIAAASRAFDPDHQIRRAMNAFLSPGIDEPERPARDH